MPLGQSHRPGQYAETKGYLPVQRFKCVLTARPHMARGQDGSLLLSCMTLSFTTSRRFIPTLSSQGGLPDLRHRCRVALERYPPMTTAAVRKLFNPSIG